MSNNLRENGYTLKNATVILFCLRSEKKLNLKRKQAGSQRERILSL